MRHTSHNRKTIGLVSTLALALVATASLGIASSPATAQTSTNLDAAKCDSRAADGYMPQWNAWGPTAIAQCKSLVAFRNQLVTQSTLSPGHRLLQWGTGDQLKLNNWEEVSFTTGDDSARPDGKKITYIPVSDPQYGVLSGPIPDLHDDHPSNGTARLFDSLELLNMERGALTGGLPEWIYALRNLRILDLSSNNLSGSIDGTAFKSTSFEQIELQGNRFSGDLPKINLDKNTGNANLVIFSVAGNNFSGVFPAGYSNFADGRLMKILAFSSNRISGDLPQWIGRLRWARDASQAENPEVSRWQMNINNNRLCIPAGLNLAAQKEGATNTDASILINLNGNVCNGVANLATFYTPAPPSVVSMEVSGSSVEVTWRIPSGAAADSQYLLEGAMLYPDALLGELAASGIEINSKCTRLVSGTPAGEGLLSATLSEATGGTNCRFHPDYMAVAVSVINQVGSRTDGLLANTYVSGSEGRGGWNFTHVVREQPIQDIAYNIGMDTTRSISFWDGTNQRWRSYRVGQQSPNPRLAVGTPVAHVLPSRGWMDRIGVGSSGNDAFSGVNGDGVTLYGGWNMISAGGEASGEDGAFMFADSLVSCDNLSGAIMILRYNPLSRSYDVILPCHQTVQRSLIAGGAWGSIEDISEFDNLMIYFRSTLSVNIRWDADESQYEPAN